MVDHVTDIPLPGRAFSIASSDNAAPKRVALCTFVAGPENRLAASAVNRLLETEAARTASSVLALCGPTGTGKTHLARGLVRSWQERNGNDCAEFLSAADFHHELADAFKRDAVAEFRRRLRGCKLLALDDIDRLPPDASIQQELRYTLDALADAGAMIVVASSTPVSIARNLTADVRSRLAAGLELRLAPPEEAAREQIAHQVSAALGRPLSAEAARRLAAGVVGTAGDVFAAFFELNGVLARPIGSDVRAVEKYLATRAARRPALRDILRTVAKYYQIPQKALKSGTRRQSAVAARAMAVYLARELAGSSYEHIGRALGGRDHSTIMHSYRKIAERIKYDAPTREAFVELQRTLQLTT